MLYTRKGDKGDTCFFGSKKRFSKTSEKAEALGSVDEINSLLGICRAKAEDPAIKKIIKGIQEDLFIIGADLAGSGKKITAEKILRIEKIIDGIEKKLPEISTFLISGSSELSAFFDYARSVARRTERAVVGLSEKDGPINPEILVYLNRLSSLLYALARFVNFKLGKKENNPSYE